MKQKRGITLVSLVITIVIILILSGVAISISVDSNGIFSKAKEASNRWKQRTISEEQSILEILDEMEKIDIKENIPNRPKLATGMTPIKFTTPEKEGTEDIVGTVIETTPGDSNWYNYGDKRWANARTHDGSMWVWIPRYAYRIDKSAKKIEIVFLRGKSDNYFDENGNIQTAKRCKSNIDIVDTSTGFTVHPAFTDESSSAINYRNGGYDKELTGIWIAKFQAGLPDESTAPKTTSVSGMRDSYYPVFQGQKYAYNYINISYCFKLSQAIAEEGNPYGLKDVDSHLIKNSEW